MKRLLRLSGIVTGLSIALAASASVAQTSAAPQTPPASRPAVPPRDNAAPSAPAVPTGVVRGRITAAATGQPLYRVRITMSGAAATLPPRVTDANGMFEITEVPAGSYSISAERAGYLTVRYG